MSKLTGGIRLDGLLSELPSEASRNLEEGIEQNAHPPDIAMPPSHSLVETKKVRENMDEPLKRNPLLPPDTLMRNSQNANQEMAWPQPQNPNQEMAWPRSHTLVGTEKVEGEVRVA